MMKVHFFLLLLLMTLPFSLGAEESAEQLDVFSWKQPHAKVLPQGDLEWAPEPFIFRHGVSLRYIDFESGDDNAGGGSPETAWKHHPWDAEATGAARECSGIHTYVFKRGVTYRGALVARDDGSSGNPIRLTSDPDWGAGEAVVSGAEVVTDWTRGAQHPDISEPDKVWYADLHFLTRSVWMIDGAGTITRIPLARTPNWTADDPQDVMAGWWVWKTPESWVKENRTTRVGDQIMHLGIDPIHLTRELSYYDGALVWTEWAIVMGTPFPTRVEAFDTERKGLAFQGRWLRDSGQIMAGNRYFLEDKPHYLDAPGEFWFERRGDGGRLYLRLPEDRDPRTVTIEAARRHHLLQDRAAASAPVRLDTLKPEERDTLDATGLRHAVISGLTFRFTNPWWDLDFPPWMHRDVDNGAITLLGAVEDILISHCRFEHLAKAVRIQPVIGPAHISRLAVTDCDIRHTDSGAIDIGLPRGRHADSAIDHIAVLRNRLHMIGTRPFRQSDGHAVIIAFPRSMEVAGNILTRCYGSGIFVFGGKGQGQRHAAPLSRQLIHHNRVEDALLATNDWGAIETWWGGPHYVWNNISINPGGYWHWKAQRLPQMDPQKIGYGDARLGYAYYFDTSYKNYVFNNLAIGRNNTLGDPHCNANAFLEINGFQNVFFTNTAYRFATGQLRPRPRAGRNLYLGNLYEDMSYASLLLSDARAASALSPHRAGPYAIETCAVGSNVFHRPGRYFGSFDESGTLYPTLSSFKEVFEKRRPLREDVGIVSEESVLRDPENGDYRPRSAVVAAGRGVRVFVPWGLSTVVGEWNFFHHGDTTTLTISDDHWNMTPYYVDKTDYPDTPRSPLSGIGLSSENFVSGPLEDWTRGALQLDGKSQYLVARHTELGKPYEFRINPNNEERRVVSGVEISNPEIGEHNFLLEIVLRPDAPDGLLISKYAEFGYELVLENFRPRLKLRDVQEKELHLIANTPLVQGSWHHLLVEVDRQGEARIFLDGREIESQMIGGMPVASLENSGDFLVGGGSGQPYYSGAIDFLRIARGTLADALTTIEELYTWQFDGPHLYDFTGAKTTGKRDAGAIQGR